MRWNLFLDVFVSVIKANSLEFDISITYIFGCCCDDSWAAYICAAARALLIQSIYFCFIFGFVWMLFWFRIECNIFLFFFLKFRCVFISRFLVIFSMFVCFWNCRGSDENGRDRRWGGEHARYPKRFSNYMSIFWIVN